MSLPQIAQLEFDDSDLQQAADPGVVHNTFAWDFEKGDFVLRDGKLIEQSDVAYLQTWIKKSLNTAKNILIYSGTDYGSEHFDLIGQTLDRDFFLAEFERVIRECLLQNSAINGCRNFRFEQMGDRLGVIFTVDSIFGTTSEAVTINA